MRIARRSGVGVHAHHANSWLASCARVVVEHAPQLHFHTLRSRAELLQIGTSAYWARHGRLGGFATMVAHELAAHFVIGQRNRARSALGHIAAIAAQQEVREPALVQHEHDFAARIDRGEQVFLQLFGKHRARAAAEFLRHVENAHLRHRLAVRARRKHHAMPRIVDLAAAQRLDRRSRAAQHKRRAGALGHPCGHIARVVARRAFLLIGAFVLFVDDDEAKRCHGAKKRASRTHDHALFAQTHRFPLVEALACRHARVHNRHGIAEAALESRHRLRGKRDFGHEHDSAAPQLERMANRTQVNLGFARPRHAIDHAHLAGAAVDARVDARERRGLAFGERKTLTRLGGLGDFFIERHGRLGFALLLPATRRLLQLPHVAAFHDLRRAAHGREQMHARAEGRHVFMSDKLDKRGAVFVEVG